MSGLKSLKKTCQEKKKIIVLLKDKKISNKEYDEHVITVWDRLEMKKMKDYHDLYL